MSKVEADLARGRAEWNRTIEAASAAASDVEENIGPAVADAECMDIVCESVTMRRVIALRLDDVDPVTATTAIDMDVMCAISYRSSVLASVGGSSGFTFEEIKGRISQSKMMTSRIRVSLLKMAISSLERRGHITREWHGDDNGTVVYMTTDTGTKFIIDAVATVKIVDEMTSMVKAVVAERCLGRILKEMSESGTRLNELHAEVRRIQGLIPDT